MRALAHRVREWLLVLGLTGGVVVVAGYFVHARERPATAPLAKSAAGRSVRWVKRELVLRPQVDDNDSAAASILQNSLLLGAKTWNDALAGCRAPELRVVIGAHRSLPPVRDGFSTVVLRRRRWCPESAHEDGECYDKSRAGFTTLYPNDAEGRRYADLREADMEINGVDFAWSLEGEKADTTSLRALVVHELGHVLGLDHPCEASTRAGGAKRPCDSPPVRASIMYPLPIEDGRAAVLEPGRAERDTLCALYAADDAWPPERAVDAL